MKPTAAAAWLCLALACLALGTRAEAQQGVFAGITGTVKDSSGAVLPGASLTVTNLATNATKTGRRTRPVSTAQQALFRARTKWRRLFPGSRPRLSSPFSST